MAEPKRYGLILKGKNAKVATQAKKVGIFDDIEDEEGEFQPNKPKKSETDGKIRRQDKSEIAKAISQDKTVYQYDEVYDKLQKAKDDAGGKSLKQEKDKKPKYIANLLKAAEKRQQEFDARVERQQLKEREKEGETFADKEVFVTKAYRDKMEQIHEYEKGEQHMEMIEGFMDVTKQANISGFYRHLLNDTLVKPVEIKEETEETTNEVETVSAAVSQEVDSSKPERTKTIYDSDSGAEDKEPPEEQIKPGLRHVKKEISPVVEEKQSQKKPEGKRNRSASNSSSSSRERSSHKRRRDRSAEKHSRRRSSSRSLSGGRQGERRRNKSRSPQRHQSSSHRRRESPRRRDQHLDSRRRDRSHDRSRRKSTSKSPPSRHEKSDRRKHEDSRSLARNGHQSRQSPERRKRSRSPTDRRNRDDRRVDKSEKNRKDKEKPVEDKKEKKEKDSKPVETPDEIRLKRLQEIFAHRNTPEQIEEYRQRYFARKTARDAGLCT